MYSKLREACALFGCSHISGYIKLSLGWYTHICLLAIPDIYMPEKYPLTLDTLYFGRPGEERIQTFFLRIQWPKIVIFFVFLDKWLAEESSNFGKVHRSRIHLQCGPLFSIRHILQCQSIEHFVSEMCFYASKCFMYWV